MPSEPLAQFVVRRRKSLKLTQRELADKAGVGLRFVRELEDDKPTLRMDKVNEVLRLFGHELGATPMDRNPSEPRKRDETDANG